MALKIFADMLTDDEVQWRRTPGGVDYCIVTSSTLTTSRRREVYLRDRSRTDQKVPLVESQIFSIGRAGDRWRAYGSGERPARRFESYDDCVAYIAQVIDTKMNSSQCDDAPQSQILVGEQRW